MKTKVIVVLVYFMTTIQNAYGRFMMHNTPALHGHSRHTKVDMDTTYAIIIMFLTFVSACMLLSIYYAYSELKHQKNKKVEEEKKNVMKQSIEVLIEFNIFIDLSMMQLYRQLINSLNFHF